MAQAASKSITPQSSDRRRLLAAAGVLAGGALVNAAAIVVAKAAPIDRVAPLGAGSDPVLPLIDRYARLCDELEPISKRRGDIVNESTDRKEAKALDVILRAGWEEQGALQQQIMTAPVTLVGCGALLAFIADIDEGALPHEWIVDAMLHVADLIDEKTQAI